MNAQGGVELLAPLALLLPSTDPSNKERSTALPEPSFSTCAIVQESTESPPGPGAALLCLLAQPSLPCWGL